MPRSWVAKFSILSRTNSDITKTICIFFSVDNTKERTVFVKSIVLSFGLPRRRRPGFPDFKLLLKRYGVVILFAAVLLTGLALGAFYAQNANSDTLQSLDFLFTTNLDARLDKGALGIFCACFASDFIFLLCVYLLGIAAWGIPFLFMLICFKGFGTGITAGYLCLSHGFSGAGFYLLVLLPGTFLFCVALIRFTANAFAFSGRAFRYSLSKSLPAFTLRQELILFSSRFLSTLAVTFIACLLDTLLWSFFAGTFHF